MPKIGETTTEILAIKAQTDLLPADIADVLRYTTQVIKVYPLLANSVLLTAAAGGWTFSNWVEIVPANTITSDCLVLGILLSQLVGGGSIEYICQLGKGGAGAETAIASFPMGVIATSNVGFGITLPSFLPIGILLPANTRIAARLANDLSTGYSMEVKLIYVELPL